jgi:hypothetical protein
VLQSFIRIACNSSAPVAACYEALDLDRLDETQRRLALAEWRLSLAEPCVRLLRLQLSRAVDAGQSTTDFKSEVYSLIEFPNPKLPSFLASWAPASAASDSPAADPGRMMLSKLRPPDTDSVGPSALESSLFFELNQSVQAFIAHLGQSHANVLALARLQRSVGRISDATSQTPRTMAAESRCMQTDAVCVRTEAEERARQAQADSAAAQLNAETRRLTRVLKEERER